jgi:hypothetical protein
VSHSHPGGLPRPRLQARGSCDPSGARPPNPALTVHRRARAPALNKAQGIEPQTAGRRSRQGPGKPRRPACPARKLHATRLTRLRRIGAGAASPPSRSPTFSAGAQSISGGMRSAR